MPIRPPTLQAGSGRQDQALTRPPISGSFNPITQGQKFDADGAYVRRWCPELADVPNKYLHEPWAADEATLKKAGVRLGTDYPKPIVEHKAGRERALEAYETLKSQRTNK